MEQVTFHFHKRNTIISKIVEWRTGSDYSHVSVEIRGFHYNAFMDKRFYKSKEPANGIIESYSIPITDEQATLIEQTLWHFIDSLYDYKAMFGFLLNINEDSKSRVFCSEIANQVLEIIIPGEVTHKKLISPGALQIALVYYQRGLDTYQQKKKLSRKKNHE